MSEKRRERKFTKEFKLEAIRLTQEPGSVAQHCKEPRGAHWNWSGVLSKSCSVDYEGVRDKVKR